MPVDNLFAQGVRVVHMKILPGGWPSSRPQLYPTARQRLFLLARTLRDACPPFVKTGEILTHSPPNFGYRFTQRLCQSIKSAVVGRGHRTIAGVKAERIGILSFLFHFAPIYGVYIPV